MASKGLGRGLNALFDDIEEVKAWIGINAGHIQCIVSNCGIENSHPLGRAQYPALADYADGVDTMRFLLD